MSDAETIRDDESPIQKGGMGYEPGQFVGAGRFQLLSILGQGGGGFVWRGYDEVLETEIALKFLPKKVRNDPRAFANLREEVLNSRRLAHPNIVTIFNLEKHGEEEPFISMELVRGRNLSQALMDQPGQTFLWEQLHPLVEQLCSALAYAHQLRVVHRDLKPSNLMLTETDQLKLADFGISRMMSDTETRMHVRKQVSGTLLYMSPQQLEGKSAKPADDIYSLGATLYELVSGTPPFYRGEILHQILTMEAQPLQQRLAEREVCNPVPASVRTTIQRCLAKDPADRPSDIEEVAADLELGLKLPGVRTKPVTARTFPTARPPPIAPTPGAPETRARTPPEPTNAEEPAEVESKTSWAKIFVIAVLGLVLLATTWVVFNPAWLRPGRNRPADTNELQNAGSSNLPPVTGTSTPKSPTNTAPVEAVWTNPAPGESTTTPIPPPPTEAQLSILARGQNVSVVLKAKSTGVEFRGNIKTNIVVPPGLYRLTGTTHAWKVPFVMEDLELAAGRTQIVSVATVKVESEPPGADVWDGMRPLGQTPLEFPVLRMVNCTLRLEKAGYYTVSLPSRMVIDNDTIGPVRLARAKHPTVGGYTNSLGAPFFPVAEGVWICATETKLGHYRTFARQWPTFRGKHLSLSGLSDVTEGWARSPRNPSEKRTDDDPAVNVSFVDAVKFCKWLTLVEHEQKALEKEWEYRLPTDAEWGKAAGLAQEPGATPFARSRDLQLQDVFPWGPGRSPPSNFANYNETNHDRYPTLAAVFDLPPNALGLHHMHGNVSEWCGDEFGEKPRPPAKRSGEQHSPPVERSVRGGSYLTDRIDHMRTNYREGILEDQESRNVGFRIVLSKKP